MSWWLNPISLVFVVASCGGCVGGFFAIVMSNCRMSRCKIIKICCGCVECERENLTEEEYKEEIANQHRLEAVADPLPRREGEGEV